MSEERQHIEAPSVLELPQLSRAQAEYRQRELNLIWDRITGKLTLEKLRYRNEIRKGTLGLFAVLRWLGNTELARAFRGFTIYRWW